MPNKSKEQVIADMTHAEQVQKTQLERIEDRKNKRSKSSKGAKVTDTSIIANDVVQFDPTGKKRGYYGYVNTLNEGAKKESFAYKTDFYESKELAESALLDLIDDKFTASQVADYDAK
jgi:hypothetical protein